MTIVCSLIRCRSFCLNDLVFGMHGIWRSFPASEFCPWWRDQTEPELDSMCMHGSWWSGVKKCISVPFILPPSADRQVKIKVLRVLTFICTFVYLLRLNTLLHDKPLATSLILFHLFYGIKCVLLVNMAKYMPLLKSFNIASTVYTINNNIKIYSR